MNVRGQSLWFGYLEAGRQSSPVVFDASVETGDSTTIYLFNLARQRMIEYRADIVLPKLRELSAEEATDRERLHDAFVRVRAGFEPRRRAQPAAPVAQHWWIDSPAFDDFDSEEIRALLMGEGLESEDDEQRRSAEDDEWLRCHDVAPPLAMDRRARPA